MRAGWTAGVTRARLLRTRAVGAEHALAIARSQSLDAGIGVLAGSAYGERVEAGSGPVRAERAVAETLLWHLRILAGWLPASGAGLVRTLAGWFELANIDARLAAFAGDGREPEPFVLGGLATAWARIDQARTIEEVAQAIAASAWGEIDGRTPAELTARATGLLGAPGGGGRPGGGGLGRGRGRAAARARAAGRRQS